MRIFLIGLLFYSCLAIGQSKINAFTIEAPPNPYTEDPMPAIKKVNANWVAVVPYAFTPRGSNRLKYGSKMYWWGERPEGVRKTIQLAKDNGLCVMVKPQVWLMDGWIGDLEFTSDKDFEVWWADYNAYIDTMVSICKEMDVEMLCIGTEMKKLSSTKKGEWFALIQKVRSQYAGKITYAANWDEYQQISFWDQLDYIGVNAYFPVLNEQMPSVASIKKAWKPTVTTLKKFSEKYNKPMLFTEYGFLSVDRNTFNTWEIEKHISEYAVNEQAQANSFEGLYRAIWQETFWHGGFIWKWTPNLKTKKPKRYTPQLKIAEKTIQKWYQKK